jgi:hypothetical protein
MGCLASKDLKIPPAASYLSIEDSIRYRGENIKSSFPIYGVQLSYLTEFISYGKDILKNKTTFDVGEVLIKDLTSDGQTSLIEFLVEQDHPAVGIAEVYVCHSWKMKFLELVAILQEHFEGRNPIIWLDLFTINQHVAFDVTSEWLYQVMKPVIGRISSMVVVYPGQKKSPSDYLHPPKPLTRTWCLWELYCAVETGCKIEIAMSKAQKKQFLEDLVAMKATAVKEKIIKEKPIQQTNQESSKGMIVQTFNSNSMDESKKKKKSDESDDDAATVVPGRELTQLNQEQQQQENQQEVGPEHDQPMPQFLSSALLSPTNNVAISSPLTSTTSPIAPPSPTRETSLSSSDNAILRNMTQTDSETSSASKPNDKKALHETITTYIGYSTFNEMISKGLKDWIIKVALKEVNKNDLDSLRKLQYKDTLISLYISQQKYEKAEKLCKEVLEKRKTKFGDDHPDTMIAASNLSTLLSYKTVSTLSRDDMTISVEKESLE